MLKQQPFFRRAIISHFKQKARSIYHTAILDYGKKATTFLQRAGNLPIRTQAFAHVSLPSFHHNYETKN